MSAAGSTSRALPFLRVPPFPGAKLQWFSSPAPEITPPDVLVAEIRRLRVGGTFWGQQPRLPANYLLVRSTAALAGCAEFASEHEVVLWATDCDDSNGLKDALIIAAECDPWHMLSGATAVVVQDDDEVRIIAAILGVAAYVRDRRTGRVEREVASPEQMLAATLWSNQYYDPYTGAPMSVREAVHLCGFWRQLIDSNRQIGGGLGFAFWKQGHVAPLLWGGTRDFPFFRRAREVQPGAAVAVWRARTSSEDLVALEQAGVPVFEVEDGFLRSQGLGADCVPPLSITVDRLGAYFDPTMPSELELLLQEGQFDDELLERARRLRELIVDAGLGKYERRSGPVARRTPNGRRHVLVAGQVEDDRAVQEGGCGLVSNLELLARARTHAPDAYIFYKPHPDVSAGHRRGHVNERLCLQHADELVSNVPLSSVIDMVDEIHVNTSLAGFEALLRGKPVTTHGVPFYAGWGLTHDLGPVPKRRTAKRTLDELVAAALLVYPRYLDPVTGLPCPAEVVVQRLTRGAPAAPGLLVRMRRLQGRLLRGVRSFAK